MCFSFLDCYLAKVTYVACKTLVALKVSLIALKICIEDDCGANFFAKEIQCDLSHRLYSLSSLAIDSQKEIG